MRVLLLQIACSVTLLLGCENAEPANQATQANTEQQETSKTNGTSRIWSQPKSVLVWAAPYEHESFVPFEEAVATCTDLLLMGMKDWRLPSITEMRKAISADIAGQFELEGMWKDRVSLSFLFWTLSVDLIDNDAFQVIRLSNGDVSSGGSGNSTYSVLCVRGQSPDESEIADPTGQAQSDTSSTPSPSPSQVQLSPSPTPSPTPSPSPSSIPIPDTTPPTVTISSTSPSPIDNKVSGSDGTRCYTFNVSTGIETNVTLYSKMDAENWVQKSTGTIFSVCVAVGPHTFSVKGVDASLNESTTVSQTWTTLGKYYEQTVGGDTVIRQRADAGSSPSPYWFTPLYAAVLWASNGCSGLSYAGYSDWTLPTNGVAKEWNAGGVKNFISGANGEFWTSTANTTVGGPLDWRYTNNFFTTSNSGESYWATNGTRSVRCMRLGN